MIRDLARAVAADLSARYYPHRVYTGPERAARDGFQNAVVFARDRSTAEAVGSAIGATRPRATAVGAEAPYVRMQAGVFTVYARSPKGGADALDHEEECDRVCDGVLTALRRVVVAHRLPLEITESKMLTRDELRAEADASASASDDRSGARSADAPGCAARVRFTIGVLVRDVTYPGASRPTGEIYEFAEPTVEAEQP